MRISSLNSILFCSMVIVGMLASTSVFSADFSELDSRVSAIKQDVIDLGKDMRIFERVAIYPDDKRVSIFLTLDVGKFFLLKSFKIKIDDAMVISRAFHHHETQGLGNGAAVRVYVGNIEEGDHKILAFFEGDGPRDRQYKRAVKYTFTKKNDPVFIEMRASDSEKRLQPEFLVREW